MPTEADARVMSDLSFLKWIDDLLACKAIPEYEDIERLLALARRGAVQVSESAERAILGCELALHDHISGAPFIAVKADDLRRLLALARHPETGE